MKGGGFVLFSSVLLAARVGTKAEVGACSILHSILWSSIAKSKEEFQCNGAALVGAPSRVFKKNANAVMNNM